MEFLIKEGWHELEGFCEHEGKDEYGDKVSGLIVRIDGKNYFTYEDPADGYRSYSRFVETDDPCTNIFPPQRVMVRTYDETEDFQRNWGILVCNPDFELILKVGTDNYDDYYPMAVYEWHPENLPINKSFKECKYSMPAETLMRINECLQLGTPDSITSVMNYLDGIYRKCYEKGVNDMKERVRDAVGELDEDSRLSKYVSAVENILTLIGEMNKRNSESS